MASKQRNSHVKHYNLFLASLCKEFWKCYDNYFILLPTPQNDSHMKYVSLKLKLEFLSLLMSKF